MLSVSQGVVSAAVPGIDYTLMTLKLTDLLITVKVVLACLRESIVWKSFGKADLIACLMMSSCFELGLVNLSFALGSKSVPLLCSMPLGSAPLDTMSMLSASSRSLPARSMIVKCDRLCQQRHKERGAHTFVLYVNAARLGEAAT